MKISTKILLATGGSIGLIAAAFLWVQQSQAASQKVNISHATMRNILLQAEQTRSSVAQMHRNGAIHLEELAVEVRNGVELHESRAYRAIPVVAAWESAREIAAEQGFEFRVIAHDPRNPENEPRGYEEDILKHFEGAGNSEEDFLWADEDSNQLVFARPVTLTRDCLACHGNPRNSPSGDGKDLLGYPMEDWKAGQNHGAFVLTASLDRVDPAVAGAMRRSSITMMIVLGIGATVAMVVMGLVTRKIARNLDVAVNLVKRVAGRDLTSEAEVDSSDESGMICHELNTMSRNLRENMRTVAEESTKLGSSSTDLTAVSSELGANAEETSAQANVVASAAEEVSVSVGSVATAAEEMSACIREIAARAAEAATVASEASTAATSTNDRITRLGTASAEIGSVMSSITAIAEQTNLLALNATIEAARAGEAGKGFAVVATEVKELAKQTAGATENIRRRVEDIQTETEGAIGAVRGISEIIHRIDEIQTAIASAVEEQAATTNEISQNSSEVARGSGEIAQNISSVSVAADGSSQAAQKTMVSAQELGVFADELRAVVAQFKIEEGQDVPKVGNVGEGEQGLGSPSSAMSRAIANSPKGRRRQDARIA